MKKTINKIYIIVFMTMCLAPMFLFEIYYLSSEENTNTLEKTVAVGFPKLINDDGINTSFGDEFEVFINQNIPFRGFILSKINLVLSDGIKNPTSNVITGKDGWVYSVETEDDYMDTNAMSDEEIKALGVTLSLIQEKVESDGGEFLFVPVPNKNTIYPEYMPVRYQKADINNLVRMYDELESVGVSYIDLRQDLLSAKEDNKKLYYKRDTHWTAPGAVVGYDSIMKKLGKNSVIGNSISYEITLTHNGDLDKLLYPQSYRMEEEYVSNRQTDYDSFVFLSPMGVEDTKKQLESFMSDREDHDNDFTTQKVNMSGAGELYMVRDSFARALLPYLIDSYDKARFVRTSSPSFEGTCDGADVVYEICERNIGNIICEAPFMYAPERRNYVPKTFVYDSELNTCICEDNGYAYKIYGTIDPDMIGEDGRIFVRLIDKSLNSLLFEAFPTFSEEYGYCSYFDKSVLDIDEYDITLISGSYESSVSVVRSSCVADEEETEITAPVIANPYPEANANHKIVFKGVTLGIGDNINQKVELAGSQTKPAEKIYSCLLGTDGMVYHYPNIEVETDMNGEIHYICLTGNEVTDENTAATESGITIGCDMTEVSKKLGRPVSETSRNCVYWESPVKVTYSYAEGKVISVILEKCEEMPVANQVTEEPKEPEEPTETIEPTEPVEPIEPEKPEEPEITDDNITTESSNETETAKGWQIINGEYVFYDRITGERVVGKTVDGITIGENGEVSLSDYDKSKIQTMIKAHNYLLEITSSTDTMEEKRKKAFDWILSFPYERHRYIRDVYKEEGIEITMANDIFDAGSGDCVSESAALAFMFHEIGYDNVYWVHDTGHSWVRCEDRLYDPLFAEAKNYEANYNAPFTDYRDSMSHSLLIY